ASRLGPGAVGQTEAFVDAIVDQVHNIDRDAAKAAAKIRAEHRSIRLPDALVLAVGKVTNATAVVTADEKWARVDPRVQVIT
ncbi:MAG TPA: PIN domain-containing protein, partial [Candidatus Dormibacteraeota bacterium]|nr:PIN domain-containing protein [Candidatus Dormibacteraeota bacterium]